MDEVLISDPHVLDESRGGRALALFVCVLFSVALLGTLAADTAAPVPVREVLGEAGARLKQRRATATWSDGSSARLIEEDLRRSSLVREFTTPQYSFLLYKHLGLVRPTVLLGEDGWLFHRHRARLAATSSLAPALAGASLAAVERVFAAVGMKVVAVCIPRKVITHPEMLPRGARTRLDLDRELEHELNRHGVRRPQLLSLFDKSMSGLSEEERRSRMLYAATGTHWTQRAEFLAARETMKVAGLRVPKDQRLGTISTRGRRQLEPDILEFGGLTMTDEVRSYLSKWMPESWEVVGRDGQSIKNALRTAGARIVVCGTSFTARRNFPIFLAHFAGESIQSTAQLGAHPIGRLRTVLRNGHRPEVFIIEHPNHSLLAPNVLQYAGEVYAQLRLGDFPVVVSAEKIASVRLRMDELIDKRNWVQVVGLGPGDVVHSGDGVLAWRVRGESTGAGGRLLFGDQPGYLDVPWDAGQSELVIPVITARTSAGFDRVFAKSNAGPNRGGVRVDSVELLVLASEANAINCTIVEREERDDVWVQEVLVPSSEAVPDYGVLALRISSYPGTPRGIGVEIFREGSDVPLEFRTRRVESKARIFLNISALAGEKVRSIRVKGRPGSRPISVTRARILRSGFE